MSNYVFNIAKGRAAELVQRVVDNSPTGCKLVLVPLSTSDTEANSQDFDNLAAVLAGTAVELTSGGWSRKDIVAAGISTPPTADDTANQMEVFFDDVTWSSLTAGVTTGLLVCYSPGSASADGAIIPLTHHDFVVDGSSSSSATVSVPAATGFYTSA